MTHKLKLKVSKKTEALPEAPTFKLRCDDALHRLKKVRSCLFDALISDPPSGVTAIGAKTKWDDDKGGKKQWIAWMAGILTEAHRVLKPGAYGLLWTLPRTSHWTACAAEDAGFEIVDVVVNIFGRSLIKGQDASVAIDKKLGLERRVVGKNKNYRKANTHGSGFVYNAKTHDTASIDPRSKAWEGYRTNLKPGQECWILVRKKHEGTVAENILKYGCGAIFIGKKNVDRIQSNAVLTHHIKCTKDKCYKHCQVRALKSQNEKSADYFSSFYYADKISRKERLEDNNTHPTPKPLELMKFFVRMITPKRGTILDPFMGSGSTGVAALKLKRSFYGIEKDRCSYDIADRRLRKAAMSKP
jgi:site-specific DNA-methyltransferase (adenine-specific)